MSSGSMINVEHGETFSNLFTKLIRKTFKSNNSNKKSDKKLRSKSNIQQINDLNLLSKKENNNLLIQSSSTTNLNHDKDLNSSSISNQFNNFIYNNSYQKEYFKDQVCICLFFLR